jgi:hypothetical protein
MFLLILLNSLVASASPTEIQVNICEPQASAQQKLDLIKWKNDATEQVQFIDNQDLSFYKSGWVLKISFNDKFKAKVTLKNNDASLDEEKDCEYDLHGDNKKWACKLSEKRDADKIKRAIVAKEINAIVSEDQLRWLSKYDRPLPPSADITNVFYESSYSLDVENLSLTLNFSRNSKGQEFNEISSRTDSDEKTVQIKLLSYLKEHNINLCADQGPLLTRLKLQSFFKPEKKKPYTTYSFLNKNFRPLASFKK